MSHNKTTADMQEGPEAFDRLRKAMKIIVSVPKTAVVPARRKTSTSKKKAAK